VQCQDLILGLAPLKTRDLNGFRRSSTLIFSLDRPLVCTSSRRWRYLLIVLLGIDVARHSGKQGIAGDRPQNTGIGKVGRRDRQRKSGIARAVSHRDHQAAFWLWTTEIMTCQQTRRHKQDGGNHRHHPNCQHFGQCHNQNDEHQLQHFNAPHSELEGSDVLPSELTIVDYPSGASTMISSKPRRRTCLYWVVMVPSHTSESGTVVNRSYPSSVIAKESSMLYGPGA
jgi:hypothetical protein